MRHRSRSRSHSLRFLVARTLARSLDRQLPLLRVVLLGSQLQRVVGHRRAMAAPSSDVAVLGGGGEELVVVVAGGDLDHDALDGGAASAASSEASHLGRLDNDGDDDGDDDDEQLHQLAPSSNDSVMSGSSYMPSPAHSAHSSPAVSRLRLSLDLPSSSATASLQNVPLGGSSGGNGGAFSPSRRLISVDILRDRAAKGDVNAQLALGTMYKVGEHVPLDYAEALKWLRAAAAQDSAMALCKLGSMYRNGRGVPADDAEALSLYRRAAAMNLPAAQFKLGKLCSDSAEAEQWFQKAALNGDFRSQVRRLSSNKCIHRYPSRRRH